MRGQIGNFKMRDSGETKESFNRQSRQYGILTGWRNRKRDARDVEAQKTINYFRKMGAHA